MNFSFKNSTSKLERQGPSLLQLPLELRRHIYSYILPYTIKSKHPPTNDSTALPTIIWIRRSTDILRACRQIHDECADMMYGTNVFVIDITFHSVKFHLTWLTAKGLKPKVLYDFTHVFARHNAARIRNYTVTVEHEDAYLGMIKYNCGGPMLTAGIKDRVNQLVRAVSCAPELGSLTIRLTDGNPVLTGIRSVVAYRVERGKDVATMQSVLEPFGLLQASHVEILGAVLPEFSAQLKKTILQKRQQASRTLPDTSIGIEPAVLWRWQMNWNA